MDTPATRQDVDPPGLDPPGWFSFTHCCWTELGSGGVKSGSNPYADELLQPSVVGICGSGSPPPSSSGDAIKAAFLAVTFEAGGSCQRSVHRTSRSQRFPAS